jgi:hypothetical protein
VPKYKSLIFYCGNPGVLCRLSLSSPNDVSIVDANGNHGLRGAGIFDGYFPIVKVSDEEVVYVTDNNIAKYYDISTGQVGYLPLGECAPQLWRSKTKQLLCFAFQPKSHYFLINLDGTDKAPAPHFDGMPAIYLPDYDTILAGGGQLKWDIPDPVPYEWSILRSYSLTNSSVHDFGSGSWVYQGGTVWFQSVPNKIPGMSIATTVQSSK